MRSRTPAGPTPLVPLVVVLALTASACLGTGSSATIGDCNIRAGATCPGNYMRGAQLVGADLWGANLAHADMSDTSLVGARPDGRPADEDTNLTPPISRARPQQRGPAAHEPHRIEARRSEPHGRGAGRRARFDTEHQLDNATICMTVLSFEGQQVDRDC